MKSKALIPLVIGVVVGIIAIKYTMDAVSAAKGAPASSEMVSVVMAQKDIPATVGITPDMIVVAQTPRTPLLPQELFTDIKQLEDRVALKSIPRGSPVLPSMIAPKGTLPGLTVRVKEGFRAVAVKIDEGSGVGYLVHPGDWVDVMAVMEIRKFGKVKTESKLILERVQVAAVGQMLNENQEESANRNVQTVTLLVRVDDVAKLHLAQTRGKVTLAMRGSDDMTTTLEEDDDEEFQAMANAAASQNTNTQEEPPVANLQKTVTVINDSASGNSRDTTQHVTFQNEDSMDVIDVERGNAARRSTRGRYNPAQPVPNTDVAPGSEEVSDNEPSEVSE
ncbi:MAG: Flp pilus assembly protein CpaB [Phycisphaerales bacterium]|nr:Flp pilus assembly protein CpaB [Phycisphaerales bacterium]